MQKLEFEAAWDRTIAEKDRNWITHIFNSYPINEESGVHFTFLREAYNYKGELLVMVLIHNCQDIPLNLNHTLITYDRNEGTKVAGIFDVPWVIPSKTSIPWTFIFTDSTPSEFIPHYHLPGDLDT